MTPVSRLLASSLVLVLAAAFPASAGGDQQQGAGAGGSAADPGIRAAQVPPAEIDDTLEIGGTEIEARKLRSRMTVEVHVNGRGPYRFVVDSGADSSVVGSKLAALLGLPAGQPAILNSTTAVRQVDRVEVESLRVGPTTVEFLELPVLEEADIGGDGLLGLDALIEQRLMLDFDKRVITVDDGRVRPPFSADEIVVTGRLRRGQLILTQVRAGHVGMEAIVDTGSEITIGNTALRDQLLRRGKAELGTVKVYGVTGAAMDLEIATVPRLKIGSVVLENVPVAFADIPPFAVFGMTDRPGLLLGTDIMELFRRVSLDFHARKVRFQLRQCDRTLARVRTTGTASRLSSDRNGSCAP
mgnify:CR=1 FL=1